MMLSIITLLTKHCDDMLLLLTYFVAFALNVNFQMQQLSLFVKLTKPGFF